MTIDYARYLAAEYGIGSEDDWAESWIMFAQNEGIQVDLDEDSDNNSLAHMDLIHDCPPTVVTGQGHMDI